MIDGDCHVIYCTLHLLGCNLSLKGAIGQMKQRVNLHLNMQFFVTKLCPIGCNLLQSKGVQVSMYFSSLSVMVFAKAKHI